MNQVSTYRSFFENSADAMLIIVEGRFVACNMAAVRMLGYHSKDEIIDSEPSQLSPEFQPDGSTSIEKASRMIEIAQAQGNHQFEWLHRRRDGSVFPVEVSLTAIEVPDGLQLHTVWRDLTQRKETENLWRESEQRFRLIFEANPDPVILATMATGAIIDVNQAFETATGISKLDALGCNSEELGIWVNQDMRQTFREDIQQYGEVNNFEAEFRVADNRSRFGLLSARRIILNQTPAMLIVIRDISRQKAAEQAVIEMDRMKSEFISAAAHELNTPLSALMGFAELLLHPDDFGEFSEAQQREFLSEIYDRGEALSRIIDDLLDISRIEAGQRITLQRQPTDLTDVLGKVVAYFQGQALPDRLRLVISSRPEHAVMAVDRHRMIQVLENLLSNALKYSARQTEITVTGKASAAGWEVVVEDAGIGMTPEQVERIFDKFYRVDGSDSAVTGLGLGMSIARQIVLAHGGEITVTSDPGVGTRVRLFLPVVPVELDAAAAGG